jgi:anti-sigma B factor antagonist
MLIQQQVLTCIIDISKLRYINSSGIGVLITILTKFRNKGGEVYLMKPSENVQKLAGDHQAECHISNCTERN